MYHDFFYSWTDCFARNDALGVLSESLKNSPVLALPDFIFPAR